MENSMATVGSGGGALLLFSCAMKYRRQLKRGAPKKKLRWAKSCLPGPTRKKCVWCCIAHAHGCQRGKCHIRDSIGGVGTDDMLRKARDLHRLKRDGKRVFGNVELKRAILMGPSAVDFHHRRLLPLQN